MIQRTMVTIPANTLVTLVVGEIDENEFVEVRYQDQVLINVESTRRL